MTMDARPDILFVGSSGLIGSMALPALLRAAEIGSRRVFTAVRRSTGTTHPRLVEIVGQGTPQENDVGIEASLGQHAAALGVFICTLGTTMAQAGSESAFAAIDRDLVLHLADLALRHGAQHAIVVSSVGADARARNFYLRTKGKMERDLSSLGFRRCDFMHPGLLLGAREGTAHRAGERIAQRLSPVYNPLLVGPLRRYRAISAEVVARAIVDLVDRSDEGIHRHEFDDMQALAANTNV